MLSGSGFQYLGASICQCFTEVNEINRKSTWHMSACFNDEMLAPGQDDTYCLQLISNAKPSLIN